MATLSRLHSVKSIRQLRFRARLIGFALWSGIFTLSLLSAFILRFDWPLNRESIESLLTLWPLFLVVKTGSFWVFRVRRVWHPFVSLYDVLRIGRAIVFSAGLLTLVVFMIPQLAALPRSILVMDALATGLMMCGLLSALRLYREHQDRRSSTVEKEPVLIIGVNHTGVAVLKAIQNHPESTYLPIGLVTDEPELLHQDIGGVQVCGLMSDINHLIRTCRVKTVLIVAGELSGREIRQLMADCAADGVAVRILPQVQQIIRGQYDIRPREPAIEDLLGRDPVTLDQAGLRLWLKDRRIMVTGSCGSIGSEIARQLLQFDPGALILVDRSESGQFFLDHELRNLDLNHCCQVVIGDINDHVRMKRLFELHRPEIVFHAAAYKHVPLMEQYPEEAVTNIVRATKNLVDIATDARVDAFVMISTDKAVNPTSVMGCCKRVAELYVQAIAREEGVRFVTVRFGNVLGSAGSVIPIFKKQIAEGGPVTVTHPEMTRFFMTIPEASQLVIQAGSLGNGGEVFVLDMGNPVRIMDLAEDMIRLSGYQIGRDIEIKVSGLRPGEKLFEELYTETEEQSRTAHPKISVADSEVMDLARIRKEIARLIDLAEQHPEAIRPMLAKIVPSYSGATAAKSRAA
jgi:FlaA1/EpsC-like NDP-sugar epimerase